MQKLIVVAMFAPLMMANASQETSIQESVKKLNADQRWIEIQTQSDTVKEMIKSQAETMREGEFEDPAQQNKDSALQNALNQLEAAENAVIDGLRISKTIFAAEELRDQKLVGGEPKWMCAANIAENVNSMANAGLKNTAALINFYISNRKGTESASAVLFEVAKCSEALKKGATVGEDLSEQDVENLINKITGK